MSLYENMMEEFIIMEKKRVSDGEGGFITTWGEGVTIKAVAVQNTTMEAKIAEKQGVTSTWKITTSKNVSLEYHDVLKCLRTGQIFRITSKGGEIISPSFSPIDLSQVEAEAWELAS